MAYTVKIETIITITDPALGGTDHAPKLTYTNSAHTQQKVVPFSLTSATKILWDPTSDGEASLTTFSLLILYSDVEVEVELTCNEGDANEEIFTVNVAPNVPLMLGQDTSRYNHSADDAFAGTLDVIDKVRVKETNGTAATGALMLFE